MLNKYVLTKKSHKNLIDKCSDKGLPKYKANLRTLLTPKPRVNKNP